jgi:hypothetical protein
MSIGQNRKVSNIRLVIMFLSHCLVHFPFNDHCSAASLPVASIIFRSSVSSPFFLQSSAVQPPRSAAPGRRRAPTAPAPTSPAPASAAPTRPSLLRYRTSLASVAYFSLFDPVLTQKLIWGLCLISSCLWWRCHFSLFLPLSRLKNSPLRIWGSEAEVFAISCSIYYCWLLGKLIQICIKMLIN